MASPPLGATILLFPEAELEPVALPSPSLEGSCCAIAPASGNANKLAASSIEREIETIATSLSELAACTYAVTLIKRGGPPTGCLFRNAAHAESSFSSAAHSKGTAVTRHCCGGGVPKSGDSSGSSVDRAGKWSSRFLGLLSAKRGLAQSTAQPARAAIAADRSRRSNFVFAMRLGR
jgi:hypothetical protein